MKIFLQILWFFIFLSYVTSASLSKAEQKKYKQLIEGQGLYTVEDNIEILTARNLKNKLYNQSHAWLIEFYNSWCGFCQRFAPSWKALGTDVKEWSDLVKIGAIDCSDEDNSPICRDFEIMGYPTLRYFHENYEEGPKKLGSEIRKGEDVDALRNNLVEHMINEQVSGRGLNWPTLTHPPLDKGNVLEAFDTVDFKVNYVFFIVENTTKSVLAPTIVLDLHKIMEVSVISVSKENTVFINKYHIHSFPKMLAVKRGELSVEYFVNENFATRENILKVVKKYLKSQNVINVTEDTQNKYKQNIFKGKWIENSVPDIAALLEAREQQALRQRVKQMGDVVFQMDLETTLRYSLKHEIATVKTIEGEKLRVLKNYLNIIIRYFPANRRLKHFLEDLITQINSYGSSVKGENISTFLHPIDTDGEEGTRLFSSAEQWLGCSGSTNKYRGYPCGVWQMFHYLTVNAAEQNAGKTNHNPREVLEAMLGYIKHFFGCTDCSQHFQDMAKRNDMQSVSELNSSIIWLWLAHNEVNKRLAGDDTEDPEHPKIQFPSIENCPKCRAIHSSEKWNLTEVLSYMRHMYGSINVRYLGSDTKVLHDALSSSSSRVKRSNGGAWIIINSMDVSMCFILYVMCFGLLVLIVKLFLKKGYKKKLYVHDLLGKV